MKNNINKLVSFVILSGILFGIYSLMMLFHLNEFLSIIVIYPIATFLIGIFSYVFFKNIWVGPGATLLVSIISMFILFNTTFWIWIFIYVFMGLLGSFIGKGLSYLNRININSN